MKKRIMGLSLVLALCLPLAVSAVAADASQDGTVAPYNYQKVIDSRHKTVSAGSYSFDCYTTLYYGTSSKASVWLVEERGRDSLAAVKSYLYEDGVAVETSGWKEGTSYIHFVNTGTRAVSGNLSAEGEYKAYHSGAGSDYTAGIAPSATYTTARSAEKGKPPVFQYPVNSKGETYGSYLDRHTVGKAPDLISALGEGDIFGYVRREDFAPQLDSIGEVQRWQAKVNENNMIPLYDLDGAVIGQFALGTSQEETDPVILARVEGLAGGRPIKVNQRAEPAFVADAYPTNAKGETYGSYLDRHEFGYAPDLMSVLGDSGKQGYIYTQQFRNAERGDCLDVYDLDGKVIDTYSAFEFGEETQAVPVDLPRR